MAGDMPGSDNNNQDEALNPNSAGLPDEARQVHLPDCPLSDQALSPFSGGPFHGGITHQPSPRMTVVASSPAAGRKECFPSLTVPSSSIIHKMT